MFKGSKEAGILFLVITAIIDFAAPVGKIVGYFWINVI